jgi:hypothetical protein
MATIFPSDPEVNDEYQGYRYNGIAWKIIGIRLTEKYLTRQEADLLYAPLQASLSYDGGSSSTHTPALIIDGGLSEVDFVDLIDANAA